MKQSSIQSGASVGLVGLGVMGRGVALNIIKSGFKLLGRDVNPESLTWLTSMGGHIAQTPLAMTNACDVIVSFVVNDAQTEDVLFGEHGLAATMKPDSVFIACSTMPPKYVKDLAQRLRPRAEISQTKYSPCRCSRQRWQEWRVKWYVDGDDGR